MTGVQTCALPICDISDANFRKAVVYGSVMASYSVEDFTLNRFRKLTKSEIEDRYLKFKQLAEF